MTVTAAPRAPDGGHPTGHLDGERQRRCRVRHRRALRGDEAVGHRPEDGRRRVRGAPGDQTDGRGDLT